MGLWLGACDSSAIQGTRCPVGGEKCACFANQTCNEGLTCLSDICVSAAGAGGSTSASSSTDPSLGGATATNVGGADNSNVGGDTGSTNTEAGGNSSATGGAGPATGGASAATGGTTALATSAATGGVRAATGGASTGTGGGTSSSAYMSQTDGWVTEATHSISGPIYTFADPGGSIILPECSSDTTSGATCFSGTGPTTEFCASGTVAKVLYAAGGDCHLDAANCDWASYWGAALAINLNQAADSDDPVAWDASAYSGISFKMVIDALPSNLRVNITLMDDTQYCATAETSNKTYTFTWSQLRQECYADAPGAAPTAAALQQIKSITWQVGGNASQSMAFGFCVSNVKIN